MTDNLTTETTLTAAFGVTLYTVLRRESDQRTWGVVASDIAAHSAEAAIRAVCSDPDKPALTQGEFVAVTQQSWRPVTVTAVQQTVLKLAPPA